MIEIILGPANPSGLEAYVYSRIQARLSEKKNVTVFRGGRVTDTRADCIVIYDAHDVEGLKSYISTNHVDFILVGQNTNGLRDCLSICNDVEWFSGKCYECGEISFHSTYSHRLQKYVNVCSGTYCVNNPGSINK
jgi:hypothetical protein